MTGVDVPSGPESARVTGLVGVYDADGGVVGELRYVVGHLLGRAECSLCDITHGRVRRKGEFDALRERLGVPFEVVHRNERRADVVAASGDALPCVLAATGTGLVVVLGRDELRSCAGDVERLEQVLRDAVSERGLTLVDG
jgi:hypothetical protein